MGNITKCTILCIASLLSAVAHSQVITLFAGIGTSGSVVGDGGPATAAYINGANGGAFDKQGNYYVADILGHSIRKVRPDGIITTFAGTGGSGYNGDGIPATAAQLNNPTAVAIDSAGNVYIDDGNSFRIRRVDAVTGIITTVAGTGISGYNGDNIAATNARLGGIQDIYLDKMGDLYLADQVNVRVRKVSKTGIITTVAGNGGFSAGGTGDGGPATAATFNWISSLACNKAGDLFISDINSAKIRKISPGGIITTVAGNGGYIYIGDNLPATAAQFNPMRITFDRFDNLVIADRYNDRALLIDHAGMLHCIAGNGIGAYAGDGGPATAASLDNPAGVVYDTCGNLYIAESSNRRVRKVTYNAAPCPYLGVAEVNGTNTLIYPNPTDELLNIENIVPNTTYHIYNMIGCAMQSGTLECSSNTVSLKELPPGIYLLQLTGPDGAQMMKRIMKQ